MDIKKIMNGSVVDFSIEKSDLAFSGGLEEAIINSLYTDARANGQKGWWGDAYSDKKRVMGSKLWTLKNAKCTNETKNLAHQYCKESLQWLLDDKIADEIIIKVDWLSVGVLYIEVNVYKNKNNRVFKFKEAL